MTLAKVDKYSYNASMAELVDAPALGAGIERCVGSTPSTRTKFVIRNRVTNEK